MSKGKIPVWHNPPSRIPNGTLRFTKKSPDVKIRRQVGRPDLAVRESNGVVQRVGDSASHHRASASGESGVESKPKPPEPRGGSKQGR